MFSWVNDWETLLGGLFTIIAAIIGVFALWWQTNKNTEREKHVRQRNLEAIRTTLPLCLDGIIEYIDRRSLLLCYLYESIEGEIGFPNISEKTRIEEVPASAMVILSQMVNALDTNSESQVFSRLVQEIQILDARSKFVLVEQNKLMVVSRLNLSTYMAQCAYVRAGAEQAFDYARGTTEKTPSLPNNRQVQAAARYLFSNQDFLDRVQSRIDRFYPDP